jgi:hypothetical protein
VDSDPVIKKVSLWQFSWSQATRKLEIGHITEKEVLRMSNGRKYEKPCTYQVKVKGTLTPEWSGWFEGFSISQQAQDETLLTGLVADQAALHGLLARIASLGMPLLSVTRLEGPQDNPELSINKEGENKNEYGD